MKKLLIILLFGLSLTGLGALPAGINIDASFFYANPNPSLSHTVYSYDQEAGIYIDDGKEFYSILPLSAVLSFGKGMFSFGLLATEFLHLDSRDKSCISLLELAPFIGMSSRDMIFGAVDMEVGIGPDAGLIYARIPGYIAHDPEIRGFSLDGVNWGFTDFIRVDVRIFKELYFSIMMKNRAAFTANTGSVIGDFYVCPIYNFGLSYSIR